MSAIEWYALFFLASIVGCDPPSSPPPESVPRGEVWITQQQLADGHFSFGAATEQQLPVFLTTTGRISFDDNKVSHVFSPVTGRVIEIYAQFGDVLKKGAPLASIDSPDVGVASAELDKARADLVAAEREYLRQKELYDAHATAQRDFEVARDAFKKAQADDERARKKAQLLRTGSIERVTQHYVLRALIDGEVVARNISPGLEVQGQYSGGAAQELFTIGALGTVWVTADVFEMDLAEVKGGQQVFVKVISYPERTFGGEVDWVSGTIDPVTRTARARCTIQNPERLLKPEMYATASIRTSDTKALVVPRRSVVRLGERTVVFVDIGRADDGRERFARRIVEVSGEAPGEVVQILHGLELGDRVVVDGALLLSEML
jgi:cobalt-zinc-cadmium efflux system membrane fusion protein